jgi:hypothetical protein
VDKMLGEGLLIQGRERVAEEVGRFNGGGRGGELLQWF